MADERTHIDGDSRPQDLSLIHLLQAVNTESDRFAERFGELHGLHRTDLNALMAIMDADRCDEPMSPSQLATALGLSASATTSLLDRLENTGHIVRDRSTTDRRRIRLVIPDKALQLGREFFTPLGAEFATAWEEFTPAERATVTRFLRVSIAAMNRVRQGWED